MRFAALALATGLSASASALALVMPRQDNGGFDWNPQVECFKKEHNLTVRAQRVAQGEFSGSYRGMAFWPVRDSWNSKMASVNETKPGGVYITGVLDKANDANATYKLAQAYMIDRAIDSIINKCNTSGGTTLVYTEDPKTFRIYIGNHWQGNTIIGNSGVGKAKRQTADIVFPDRPGMPACEPETACFATCDHKLRDCLIPSADARRINEDSIARCYRQHSDCLANTCACSDAPNPNTAGYPVMSKVDVCFIGCRTDLIECRDGDAKDLGTCEDAYKPCMTQCLPPAKNSGRGPLVDFDIGKVKRQESELPFCDPASPCIHDRDHELKDCLLAAANGDRSPCYNAYFDSTETICKCYNRHGPEGYPLYSEFSLCAVICDKALFDCDELGGTGCTEEFSKCIPRCDTHGVKMRTLAMIENEKRQQDLPDCSVENKGV